MPDPFRQLQSVLDLEARRGYNNDAVLGGLDEFARQWNLEVLPALNNRETAERVGHIVQLLSDYPALPREVRPSTIRHLQDSAALLSGARASGAQPSGAQASATSASAGAAARPAAASPAPGKTTPTRGTSAATPAGKTPAAAVPGAGKAKPQAKAAPSPAGKTPATGARTQPSARMPAARAAAGAGAASGLHAPLNTLPGIGAGLAQTMAKLGLIQVGDLLWHLPFRYNDYSNLVAADQARIGDEVTLLATVKRLDSRRTQGRRTLTTAVLVDDSGTIGATFWNPYIDRALHTGQTYYFSGKVGAYLGKRVLESPEFEPASDDPTHTARIVPVYPLTEGLPARVLRKHIRQVVESWAPRLSDPLPPDARTRLGFPGIGAALQQVHFPDNAGALDLARRRLAFDELLVIQLGVLGQHRAWQSKPAHPLPLGDAQLNAFLAVQPFQLTGAQHKVLRDIRRDLTHTYPMTRLLQGDVGSGKTVIAAAAMWAAVCHGAQAALMAPTEILAEQHSRKLADLFARLLHPQTGWPLRVEMLTGSVTGKRREAVLEALASGDVDLLIGTHALIQEGVRFRNLAVVVVDEQHRFGVNQRAALRDKIPEPTPHTLVMTATPIPRTLALTIYGDMDVSVIDELPPGRQPIKTYWIKPDRRERVYGFIKSQIAEGRQAFIIYPLVDESDALEDVGAAVAEHKRLQTKVFPGLKVGLLHGRLSSRDKDTVMRAFAAGAYHILVSTAVVEVGIDIPNATVILIENAERFGLAQLHQFRGRVGRGAHASYCILVSEPNTDVSSERLRAMETTQDGFLLAETDLRLRGPGEFFGTRQSGLPDLKLARLSDTRLLELARREAETILSNDPTLSLPEHQMLAQRMSDYWSQELDLS